MRHNDVIYRWYLINSRYLPQMVRDLWQQCCCYLLLHYFSFYEIYDNML